MRPLVNVPRERITFDLDEEERAMLNKVDSVTREEIWELLEQKRHEELDKRTKQMQGLAMASGRCPVCTLQPPCRHFKESRQIVKEAETVLYTEEFKKAI